MLIANFHRGVASWSSIGILLRINLKPRCPHGGAVVLLTYETPAKLFGRSVINILHLILETVIYRISPEGPQTLLATPNWPQGMKPSFTVSWIVTLPSQYQADLQFLNVSQPKCNDRHTAIKVKLLGQEEELMSRREDEVTEDSLLLPQSFYLNMSNCIPEEGQFKAMTRIILKKKPGKHT